MQQPERRQRVLRARPGHHVVEVLVAVVIVLVTIIIIIIVVIIIIVLIIVIIIIVIVVVIIIVVIVVVVVIIVIIIVVVVIVILGEDDGVWAPVEEQVGDARQIGEETAVQVGEQWHHQGQRDDRNRNSSAHDLELHPSSPFLLRPHEAPARTCPSRSDRGADAMQRHRDSRWPRRAAVAGAEQQPPQPPHDSLISRTGTAPGGAGVCSVVPACVWVSERRSPDVPRCPCRPHALVAAGLPAGAIIPDVGRSDARVRSVPAYYRLPGFRGTPPSPSGAARGCEGHQRVICGLLRARRSAGPRG